MSSARSKGVPAGGAACFGSVRKVGGGRIYPKNGKALAIPWGRFKKWLDGKKAKGQLVLPFPPPKALRPSRPAAKVRHTPKHTPNPRKPSE